MLRTVVHRKKSSTRELVETLLMAGIMAALIMTFVARAYTVNGESMLPTLHHGERLLVDKLSYRFVEPARGDIVVFKYPANPKEQFIKRIIGVPGDTVAIKNGIVYVNGIALEEDYISAPARIGFREQQVPPGTYFVLGDNRNNSEDSRFSGVGFVPKENIVGRAIWRYWPIMEMGIMQRPEVFAAL
ncbi:MAG: signal peptidase I [Firmicutes bacterium]|mgnify:FL=1|nr:signal peptidase I [Bacillota bacterium]